MAVVEGESW